MKKVLILSLVVATITLFVSCAGCSHSGKRTAEKDGHSQAEANGLVDPEVYETSYDSLVRELKKLPKYKDVLFLSPKETQEYLTILLKEESRFKSEKQYYYWSDEKDFIYHNLKISIDTSQSFRPIMEWRGGFYNEESSYYRVDMFYNPKLKLGYLKQTINGNFKKEDVNIVFDSEIRNGFKGNQKI